MADKKISALTGATTPLAGTEVLPIVQGSATVKVSVANLTAGRAVAMAGGSFTDNITQSTAAKGVNFTANTPAAGMTSQLLNWYEEGTWTPTFYATVGAFGSVTYNYLRVASYTRVGRLVTIQMSIGTDAISIGTASGNILILGLPFVPISRGALAVGVSSAFGANTPCNAAIEGGNISLYIRSTSNGANTALQASSLGTVANSNYLTLNGSYIV